MPHTKPYTLYFYSQSKSCILYFGINGTSKKAVLKLGTEMVKPLEAHYASMGKNLKITVKAEEYKDLSEHRTLSRNDCGETQYKNRD